MVLVLDPNVEQDVAETVEHGRKPVAMESAFTAMVIRVRFSDALPPISASASDSSNAVCAANRNSGIPAVVARHGFSLTTSTWPTCCSNDLMR